VKGFTLLELLAVLLIAAAAIALVMPQLTGGRAPLAQRASAQELASALRNTRSEAIARNREVAFVVPADGDVIRFFPDGSSSGGRVLLGGSVVEVDRLTGKVTVQ
jgi:prepilin-type N-terminal cleavage/methylation domain-containing protein